MKRIKYLFFFWATKDYNTLTGMGTIASTCLYNTAKTASNFWTLSDITRYQVVPKKCLFFFPQCLSTFKKKKKTIFHLLLLWCFKERTGGETYSDWRNTTKQKKKKNSSPQGLTYALSQISKVKKKKTE